MVELGVELEKVSLNIKGVGKGSTPVTELGFIWTVMGAGTRDVCCRRLAFYAYPDSNRASWDVLCGIDTQRSYGMTIDVGLKQVRNSQKSGSSDFRQLLYH